MMMSKTYKFVIWFVLVIALIASVNALGVTPSRLIIDYKQDAQQEVSFRVVNSENRDMAVLIYPRGELARYVKLEKNVLFIPANQTEAIVNYVLNIPSESVKPGSNSLEIVIEEAASQYSQQVVLGGKIAVVHQLIVMAPYEGKYATLKFMANPSIDGELQQFTYTLFNEGKENIEEFKTELKIYDSGNKLVGTEEYKFESLAAGDYRKEVRIFNEELLPGSYRAVVKINYDGKIINADTAFTVGQPLIEIDAVASSEFRLGAINKVDLAVSNKWSETIKNVFAEIIVQDENNKVHGIFKTISDDVGPFSGAVLFGYWDTENIFPGNYNLLVKTHYGGRATEKEFKIYVTNDELISSNSISGRAVSPKSNRGKSAVPVLILAFIVLIVANILLIRHIRKGRNQPPSQLNGALIKTNIILAAAVLQIINLV
jgi:hypothetical protein